MDPEPRGPQQRLRGYRPAPRGKQSTFLHGDIDEPGGVPSGTSIAREARSALRTALDDLAWFAIAGTRVPTRAPPVVPAEESSREPDLRGLPRRAVDCLPALRQAAEARVELDEDVVGSVLEVAAV